MASIGVIVKFIAVRKKMARIREPMKIIDLQTKVMAAGRE